MRDKLSSLEGERPDAAVGTGPDRRNGLHRAVRRLRQDLRQPARRRPDFRLQVQNHRAQLSRQRDRVRCLSTRAPSPADIEALVRDLLLRTDAMGLVTQYVRRMTAATLPTPATRTMQVRPATIAPEALAMLLSCLARFAWRWPARCCRKPSGRCSRPSSACHCCQAAWAPPWVP
ncbi:FUSC family protein [Massilia sp. B-10]|nr:FUSC family protein [Massilia sp. B-10]